MVRALVSLFLLGIFPHVNVREAAVQLPGIELVQVSPPAPVRQVHVAGLSASGADLIDLESGEELFSLRADEAFPMASTTKIMTALLLLEHHASDEVVTIPRLSEQVGGSVLGLRARERFRLDALVKAMLIPSANDAAYALAMHHSKSIAQFVTAMNERALSLGLSHTHFENPAGLDDDHQYASPRDLAWLTAAALKFPLFHTTVAQRTASIASLEGSTYELRNTNELLRSHDNVEGVKTGTTTAARECLIVLFREGRGSYLLVLLGARDRYGDAVTVMEAVHQALAAAKVRPPQASLPVNGRFPLAPPIALHLAKTGSPPWHDQE